MYKIITLASSILCVIVLAKAQEGKSNKILNRFELVAGPSFSNNSGYLPDYDSKAGYSFGVGYYQNLSKSFSFNFRISYEMKGSAATYSYGLTDDNGNVDLDDKYTIKFKYLSSFRRTLLPTEIILNLHMMLGLAFYLVIHSKQVRRVY
jgi:hypothetical protein